VAKDSAEAKALSKEMNDRMWKNLSSTAAPVDTLASQAEKGDAKAQHNLAFQFEQQKQYDEAIKWYTRAAEQGYGVSEMNLAQMYERGTGVKQDFTEAKRWYRKSMERGSGESLYRLASLSDKTQDYSEALKLYRRGVKQGDYRAMVDLGDMLEQGRGVKRTRLRRPSSMSRRRTAAGGRSSSSASCIRKDRACRRTKRRHCSGGRSRPMAETARRRTISASCTTVASLYLAITRKRLIGICWR